MAKRLLDLSHPQVMGIINATPDSFAVACRHITEAEVLATAAAAIQQGASILDIGGCSTRPGYVAPPLEEEWRRVDIALRAIRNAYPDIVISLDTFRAEIADRAIRKYHIDIVNDVSGIAEEAIIDVTAAAGLPYILTHNAEVQSTGAAFMSEIIDYLQVRIDRLHRAGISDVIVDPGYGFGKTVPQNLELLYHQDMLDILGCPILTGLSRKSMIFKTLGNTPADALNGTTALNMIALERKAAILRVHDVREAVEAVRLYEAMITNSNGKVREGR